MNLEIPLVTSCLHVRADKFWTSLMLYHNRPNLINRKLLAVSQILFCKVDTEGKLDEIFTSSAILYESRRQDFEKINLNFIRNIVGNRHVTIEEVDLGIIQNSDRGTFISVRLLLGRNHSKCVEVVILDKTRNSVSFLASQEHSVLLSPPFWYHIELTNTGNLRIRVNSFEEADTASAVWLVEKLFPKLVKWLDPVDEKLLVKSLNLISSEQYFKVYMQLKETYSAYLVKMWPEKSGTDPKKFVFEDLAIAAYLICLWSDGDKNLIRFVDCGCGNGLLVHILNQEGFNGYGMDLRRRKLWDIYPASTQLIEGIVTQHSVFAESTWLIGNHSDELTPWIPIIALKSSPKTNFFVLPCCPYDFNGQKYIRTNTKLSQYANYLNYIEMVCVRCGFETRFDKLRIPSTKRTCLVGINTGNNEISGEIVNFVKIRLQIEFKPRSSVEKVRNCTQLDRHLIEEIVRNVVEAILETDNYLGHWNKGGTVTISNLCRIIDVGKLKILKHECGGLQTLLRNHRYLFVIEDGAVSLRLPPKLVEEDKYKEKPCWYFRNHPNRCLYQTEICGYRH